MSPELYTQMFNSTPLIQKETFNLTAKDSYCRVGFERRESLWPNSWHLGVWGHDGDELLRISFKINLRKGVDICVIDWKGSDSAIPKSEKPQNILGIDIEMVTTKSICIAVC